VRRPSIVWALIGLGAVAFAVLVLFVGLFAAIDILPMFVFVGFAVAYMVLSAGGRSRREREVARERAQRLRRPPPGAKP
jgi:hypothetical protein